MGRQMGQFGVKFPTERLNELSDRVLYVGNKCITLGSRHRRNRL